MKKRKILFSLLLLATSLTLSQSISPYAIENTSIDSSIQPFVVGGPTINNYWIENVTDEGFDFNIVFNSTNEVTSLHLPYWKNGNYGGMKSMSPARVGTNQFKAHIKMKDIGSGTEYVYVGIHPSTSNGSYFLTDLTLKLDTTNPNLNLSLSNTNWTNQNIYLTSKATDNMNIIERRSFINKLNQISTEDVYSEPNILLITGYDTSPIRDYIGNRVNVTTVNVASVTSINQLKRYDLVIYDGYCWSLSSSFATFLNQAFEEGVSIITNFNDDPFNLAISNSAASVIDGNYTFKNNVVGTGYFNGRLNRFSYIFDGKSEGDSNYYKIGAGTDTFVISNVTHSKDDTTTPAVLMKTHSNGNKWIHFQSSSLSVRTNAMYRAIDEIMTGTMKTRQTYTSSYEISENGTYGVEVEDFSGNKTKQTVNVTNIDKTPPTMVITGVPTTWTNSATLTVTGSDNLSGVSKIILPNGYTVINTNSTSYTVAQNGDYTFRIIDNAGNEYSQTVKVSYIDTAISDIMNINGTTTLINKDNSLRRMTFTFNPVVDSQAGIKGYSYVIDKSASTNPDNTVDITATTITKDITDTGAYYLHIKAIDNAGNVSKVIHHKMDYPNLKATSNTTDNKIRLDWTMDDINGKTFKVYQKKPGNTTFQSISTTNFATIKQVKVLNIYPNVGNHLKGWMENPNSEDPNGYGKGIIKVDEIDINNFNLNPSTYLKNADGTWKYDVLMFGTWDANNYIDITKVARDEVEVFIQDGRGVLFGHDTTNSNNKWVNFSHLGTKYLNMINTGSDSLRYSQVFISKKGLLTNYPWNIGDLGTKLVIPSTHSYGQGAYGDIWMQYDLNSNASNNFYLTTWNNTAMVQTGHSNATATPDEQKLLANTLFYLNQLSTDNFLEDNSGQDVAPPTNVSNVTHSFTENGFININFANSEDVGSSYEYYVESQNKDNNSLTLSNVVKSEIKAGFKGYSYVIDSNPNTIPDNIVEQVGNDTITIKTNNSQAMYLHIKAVDNVDNSSEVLHYNITDTTPPEVTYSISPNTWTNKTVTITVNATDVGGSGVKDIMLPNGTIVKSNTTSFTTDMNGSYSFKVSDFMGNETIKTIVVSNIDKTSPDVTIKNNTNWTNQNVQVTITATD